MSTTSTDSCGGDHSTRRITRQTTESATGIDESALAKFYNRKRGLSLDNLDELCGYLGLRITAEGKPAQRKGK